MIKKQIIPPGRVRPSSAHNTTKILISALVLAFTSIGCDMLDGLIENWFSTTKLGNCDPWIDTSSLLVIPDAAGQQIALTGIIRNDSDVPLYDVSVAVYCIRDDLSANRVTMDFYIGELGAGEGRALDLTGNIYGDPCYVDRAICREAIPTDEYTAGPEGDDDVVGGAAGYDVIPSGEADDALPMEGILIATCPSRLPYSCMPDEAECQETYTEEISIDLGSRSFTYSVETTLADPIEYTESTFYHESYGECSGQVFEDGWMHCVMHSESNSWGTDMAHGPDTDTIPILGKIDYAEGDLSVRICQMPWDEVPLPLTEGVKQVFLDYCDRVCSLIFE